MIIQVLGQVEALDLLEQTLEVQRKGGMKLPTPVMEGRRKRVFRTAGGVYLQLLQDHVSKEQYNRIMASGKKFAKKTLKNENTLPSDLDKITLTEHKTEETKKEVSWLDRLTGDNEPVKPVELVAIAQTGVKFDDLVISLP